jgi:phage gp29-like protein
MAKAQKQADKSLALTISQIKIYQLQRQQLEIDKWRQALRQAESRANPYRKALYEIYHELDLDPFLNSLKEKRIRNVRGQRIHYAEDGTDTAETNRLLEAPWFSGTIRRIMESLFWGHSLLEFSLESGMIAKANLIPRQHVRPELQIVVLNPFDMTGLSYNEPPYAAYTLEATAEDGFGLYNVAAANVIYKRGGMADFANFVEVFGSPIREYRYDPATPGAKEEVEKVARDSSNSGAVIVPKDWADFVLHQTGSTSSSKPVHSTFIQDLKDELAILILGQTMTTQNGSSKSQGEVHQDEQEKITQDDMLFVENILNYNLKPKLAALGYPVEKGSFRFDRTEAIPIQTQLDMDIKLAAVIDVPADYFYSKYNIPMPDRTGVPEAGEEPPEKKK